MEGPINRIGARTGLEPPGAYLFVDDDDEVLRFRLDNEHVRIGRDEGNDIWLDHPTVPPHALVIYRREGVDNIKVYEGAKVQLNGVVIAGMHRLYSGDRIGVADREFIYARDDTPAEVTLGLTVIAGEEALRAMVMRRTRIVIGRREGDLPLADPSISERHLIVECYSAEALFLHNSSGTDGIEVDSVALGERRRLRDGAIISLGRLSLRVRLLPADANGLLVGLSRRRSAGEIAGASRYASAPARPRSQGVEPVKAPTLASPDPVPAPQAQRQDSWKPERKRREPVEGPSVRVRRDVYDRGRGAAEAPESPQMKPRPERRAARPDDRITGRAGHADLPPQRKSSHRRSGFHEQLTNVLQTADVHRMVEAHYRETGAEPESWLTADTGRYRPSREPGYRQTGGQGRPANRPERPGHAPGFAPADKAGLTNVLDVVADRDRLNHDVVGLDPEAMPEQLSSQRRRGPAGAPPEGNDWNDVDAAQRRYRKFEIDNSPRYFPDEDE